MKYNVDNNTYNVVGIYHWKESHGSRYLHCLTMYNLILMD